MLLLLNKIVVGLSKWESSIPHHAFLTFIHFRVFRQGQSITIITVPFIFAILRGTERMSILSKTRKWYSRLGAVPIFKVVKHVFSWPAHICHPGRVNVCFLYLKKSVLSMIFDDSMALWGRFCNNRFCVFRPGGAYPPCPLRQRDTRACR